MSEMYEAVVFHSDEHAARAAFAAVSPSVRLRLAQIADDVFGVYRVAGRADPFDQAALEFVAKQLSVYVNKALAVLYDNRSALQVAVLYVGGQRVREFGNADAWWAPYGDDGELALDGPRYREAELRPAMEYDCVYSAIDAGLEAIHVQPALDKALLKQAFCYENRHWLAEK